MTENTVRNIIKTAIQREKDAHALYTSAADRVDAQHAKALLQDLAAQEAGHRNRLEGILAGDAFRKIDNARQKQVEDLKITDYLVEVPLDEDSDFQDILIVAGKREKASHDLYSSLAQVTDDEDVAEVFEFLAQEELTHKNRVETLYEEFVYKEN